MNSIFEPFKEFIAQKPDLSDDPRKQHRDRFQDVNFSDLTTDELGNLNLPDDDLNAIHLTFSSQSGRRYNAVHVHKDGKPYILLCGLDRDYYDFREVGEQITRALRARAEGEITDRTDDIAQVIRLKKQVTAQQVANWLRTFYSSVFSAASVTKVYYHDLLINDFDRVQIPEEKVSKGDVERPMEKVMKRHELDRLCREHAQKATVEIRDINIIAIHPYHDELEFNKKREPPIDNLHRLLMGYDTNRFGLLLMDSYDHYALQSHELVDEGRVGMVIFTKPHEGIPLDKKQVRVLKGTERNYYGGSYGQQCVRTAVKYISRRSRGAKLRPINDGILWSDEVERREFGYEIVEHLPYQLSLRERISAARGVSYKDLLQGR